MSCLNLGSRETLFFHFTDERVNSTAPITIFTIFTMRIIISFVLAHTVFYSLLASHFYLMLSIVGDVD